MHPWDKEPELYEMPEELFQKMNSGKLSSEQWDQLQDDWWNKTAGDIREYQRNYPQQKANHDMGKRMGLHDKDATFRTPVEYRDFEVERYGRRIERMEKDNLEHQQKHMEERQQHSASPQHAEPIQKQGTKLGMDEPSQLNDADIRMASIRERFRQIEENRDMTQQQELE